MWIFRVFKKILKTMMNPRIQHSHRLSWGL